MTFQPVRTTPVARRSSALDRPGRDIFDNPESRLRFEAYSRLQASAVAFGESLPIPEIVAIGGQSDGKSSLLEAFLGFRFNVREVEMGTRRPLIVQMIHDPTATEPRCRLQDEDSEEYGPPIVPETSIAEAIMKRTEEHLRKLGGATVSSKPIVMRAEYAFCPNLTIVDTPGFILKARDGEADTTPEDIMKMVKAQAAPPHRLILFLQQSSVEWASALWLHVVQEVDPQFQRTIIVASKFDNRLKEFQERWEVDKYLSAVGYLPSNVKPFFVALPKDRNITSSAEWRKTMSEVDAGVFKHLRDNIKDGFDEERFGARIGFGNLRRFLEDELARRYREAAPSTLALLQERCEAVAAELMAAETKLRSAEDVGALRRAAMRFAASMESYVVQLLEGTTGPEPSQHGMTSEDERIASRMSKWPGVASAVAPANSELKLFGGSAFERCLNELQEAASALRFPAVASDRMANVLLAYKGNNNFSGAASAAEDIARQSAKELIKPLLDTACSRLAFVIRRVFEIAADRSMQEGSSKDSLQPYVAFHAALRSAHQSFLNKLEESARSVMNHHLEVATSKFAMNLLTSTTEFWDDEADKANGYHAAEDINGTTPFRESQMTVPETPPAELLQHDAGAGAGEVARRAVYGVGPGRHLDGSPSKPRAPKSHRTQPGVFTGHPMFGGNGSYEDVSKYAERLFVSIRSSVAQQQAPTTLKACFLGPIKERLALDVSLDLFAKCDAEFMTMFTAAGALATLKARRDLLQKRVEGLVKCKNEFQELARCI